ncbi:RidA family protein [Pseudoroseicyclus tamaricis]|uniref:RidA family protein n=1 Tax=Pseudoroseicyclus tamaricis TaxID=2705421 RepID=A0A6B2JQK8_9RHOB|nr:RidA family protein [Pseudoroseicyclus tamaricis]NDV00255.1 RidA family protein [Pseudoroseicyclus tamaricis]
MLKIVDKGARSHLPFSPAIIAGDLMFISGQASVSREDGAIIEDTFEGEMRRSIDNLEAILKEAGATLDHVIQVRSYLGAGDWGAEYNRIYAEYFPEPRPVRTTISDVLGTLLKFELDAVAYLPSTRMEAERL